VRKSSRLIYPDAKRPMFVPVKLVLTIFVLMLASLSPISGAASPDVTSKSGQTSLAERATQLARDGRVEEALQLLQAALATRPTDLDSRLVLAEIYARDGKAEQAEHEFREALRLHPASPLAALALSGFYNSIGSLDPAERVLEDAVRVHPKLAEIRIQLALVLALEHKYAEAKASILLVPPPVTPNTRVLYFRIVASIYSGLGDLHAAAHATEDALHVKPADEKLQLFAAVAEAEAGEWQDCIRHIAPLFASQPTATGGVVLLRAQLATHVGFGATLLTLRSLKLPDGQALQLRIKSAEILAAADKHREAADEFELAVKMKGEQNESLLYNLAIEQYRSRQLDEALATLAAFRGKKESAQVENLAGDIEEQKGDSLEAVHSYQKAIALAPHEEQYRLSLGAELLKYHTYEPAVEVFQQAAALFPTSARIYVGLGMAYSLQEKYDDSASAFLHADELDHRSGHILGYLGETQLRRETGPNQDAVSAICNRADSGSDDPAAVTWCAALLFRKAYLAGDQASASDVIRRLRMAINLTPDDPIANCSLGHALEWTAQLTEARHWLETCVALRPGSAEDHFRLSRVYQRLGLAQEAREQADLTAKATAQEDQRDAVTKKFVYEMLAEPKHAKDSN
jgi:predicted Zn-dependent protease